VKEAAITIGAVRLSDSQSMAVRVAVGNMLLQLQDLDYCKALGRIAAPYQQRLEEVQRLLLKDAR
jgi:hypothetical protein